MEWKSLLSLDSSVLVWALIFFTVANGALETALLIQGYFRCHWEALTQSQGSFCSSPHPPAKGLRVHEKLWGDTARTADLSWPIPEQEKLEEEGFSLITLSFSPPPHQGGEGVSSCGSLSCCLGLASISSEKCGMNATERWKQRRMIANHLPPTGGTDFLIQWLPSKDCFKMHSSQSTRMLCFSNWTIDYTLHRKSRFVKETLMSLRASGAAPKVISISQA